ncbi:hypothetical protein AHAS_Ahas02G0164600 [Arachis hypogaea]
MEIRDPESEGAARKKRRRRAWRRRLGTAAVQLVVAQSTSSSFRHHVAKEGLPPVVAPFVELAVVAVQATAAATLHAVAIVIHGGRGSKCARGERERPKLRGRGSDARSCRRNCEPEEPLTYLNLCRRGYCRRSRWELMLELPLMILMLLRRFGAAVLLPEEWNSSEKNVIEADVWFDCVVNATLR